MAADGVPLGLPDLPEAVPSGTLEEKEIERRAGSRRIVSSPRPSAAGDNKNTTTPDSTEDEGGRGGGDEEDDGGGRRSPETGACTKNPRHHRDSDDVHPKAIMTVTPQHFNKPELPVEDEPDIVPSSLLHLHRSTSSHCSHCTNTRHHQEFYRLGC